MAFLLIGGVGALINPAFVHAGSGFELRSQSATALGSAMAGMTAGAYDVSYIAFNPAALAMGAGTQLAVGATGLATNLRYSNQAASTVLGVPIRGSDGGNAGTSLAVPNFYIGTDLFDAARIGLALTSRFGLGSHWSSDWVGRYHAVDSELATVDLMPSISFKPSESLALGLSLDVQYARVKTENPIDFGTIDQVLAGGLLGGFPTGSDGSAKLRADDWAVGYSLGLIYDLSSRTQIGLSYHSSIRQRPEGTADFSLGSAVGLQAAALTGAFASTGARTALELPASAAIGVRQLVGRDWELVADVKWTQWSALKSLDVQFANPTQPPLTTQFNWHDSWFYALGARYRVNDQVAWRFGVAWDEGPVRSATRTPAIPDANSYWLTAGFEWSVTPTSTLNISAGRIRASDASIDLLASSPGNTFRGNLSGAVLSNWVNFLALQMNYKF